MYDKNIYENYPSYLMGKKKESVQKDNTDPILNNIQRKKEKIHKFRGLGGSIVPLADYGIRTSFVVEGTAQKENDKLRVSASAKGDPANNLFGSVSVKQNNKIYSRDNFKKSTNGYVYPTGGPFPLGEAYVNLPDSGDYDVEVDVFGDIYDAGSHFPTRFNKKLDIK